jgi:hypothetical protein
MIVGLLIMSALVAGVAVGEDACACGDILSTMMQRIERMDSTINIIARQDIETRVNGRFGQAFSEVDGKCSSESPVSSLPIGSVQGIPSDVSGEAICSLYCRATDGCIAFNFLETPTSDGTQCQLFTGPSSECTDSTASCRYFVMNGEDGGCGSIKKTEGCRDGYTFNESTGSCYRFSNYGLTWDEAASDCSSDRPESHLVFTESAEEIDYLLAMTPVTDINQVWWTGGIGSPSGSTFVWKSDRYTTVKDDTQERWCPGKPDNVVDGSCIGVVLRLNSDSNWCQIQAGLDDAACSDRPRFICEYELTNIGY